MAETHRKGGEGAVHVRGFEYSSVGQDAGLEIEGRKPEEHRDPYAHHISNEQASVAADAVHERVVRDA